MRSRKGGGGDLRWAWAASVLALTTVGGLATTTYLHQAPGPGSPGRAGR